MSFRIWVRDTVEYHGARIIGTLFWPPTSAAALVKTDDNEVLTLNVDGHHELPGGIVKAGEDPRAAAKREVKEETGFDITVGNLLDIRTEARGNRGIHYYFEGNIVGGEKNGSWEGTPEFVPLDEVKDRVWRLHHSHVHEYLFPNGEQVHSEDDTELVTAEASLDTT